MPVPTDSPSRELDLALARVAQADRQLVTAAEQSYRRARSAAVAGAVTMGIGAALIGTLAGSTGRRRLVSGVLGVALPFVASAVADVVGQIGKSQLNEEKQNDSNGAENRGSARGRAAAGSLLRAAREADA